jgi:hypothetical protein
MNLQYLKYTGGQAGARHFLAIVLGIEANKICYILADKVPPDLKKEIRANIDLLSTLDVFALRTWFKERMPNFNGGGVYKEAHVKNITTEYSFDIGKL